MWTKTSWEHQPPKFFARLPPDRWWPNHRLKAQQLHTSAFSLPTVPSPGQITHVQIGKWSWNFLWWKEPKLTLSNAWNLGAVVCRAWADAKVCVVLTDPPRAWHGGMCLSSYHSGCRGRGLPQAVRTSKMMSQCPFLYKSPQTYFEVEKPSLRLGKGTALPFTSLELWGVLLHL